MNTVADWCVCLNTLLSMMTMYESHLVLGILTRILTNLAHVYKLLTQPKMRFLLLLSQCSIETSRAGLPQSMRLLY